jgi:hypothetical protein
MGEASQKSRRRRIGGLLRGGRAAVGRLVGQRVRSRSHDIAFLAGCALIVGAFVEISRVTGMFAGGVALIALAVLHRRGGAAE